MHTFAREARPSERTAASTRAGSSDSTAIVRVEPSSVRDLAELGHAAADGVAGASLVHVDGQQRVDSAARPRRRSSSSGVGLAVERRRGDVQPGEHGGDVVARTPGRRASATGTHCSSPSSSTASRRLTSSSAVADLHRRIAVRGRAGTARRSPRRAPAARAANASSAAPKSSPNVRHSHRGTISAGTRTSSAGLDARAYAPREPGRCSDDGRSTTRRRDRDAAGPPPYAQDGADVVAGLGLRRGIGPDRRRGGGAARRATARTRSRARSRRRCGPSPLQQLRDPMNIMLVAVTVVSFVIGEVSTGVIVALLILLNVVLGSRQELNARASIDALSNLQVPQAKVVRDGAVALVPAVDLVPGDLVQVEAGDLVPADGRILHAATLEAQEAALTGESAPIPKDADALAGADVALGDRSNMLFQNTAVTRGTAAMVVTATGMQTQMGQIATMLTSVTRTRSPLQKELGSLTKVLGIDRLGRGRVHRGRRRRPRRGLQRRAAAGHGDGDLGDPDGHAGVRLGPAVARRQAARRGEGGRQEPDRRRDARRDQRDQHRQDRHADDERDDGLAPLRGRVLVHGRGRGLPQERGDPVGRRRPGARLHAARARARARQRRDGRRRRQRRRRPDRGRARRARGQARRRRRGDPAGLSAPGRGAVRLRLQVHGHVPPRVRRRGPSASSSSSRAARTSCSRAAPCPAAR